MDPYKILGVDKNASADEIKKAYRKLAHQHHPDKKSGDAEKFKEINEAYQILSDSKKRSQYDQFGTTGNNGGFGGGGYSGGGFDFGGFGGGGGGFEDIFEMFSGAFGGSGFGAREEATKGEDLYLQVKVGKKEFGTRQEFEFNAFKSCDECDASGVAKGYKMETCSDCKGSGQIRRTIQTPFGNFMQSGSCPKCKGKGKIPERLCPKCNGAGRYDTKRKMEIHIPADLEDGYKVIAPKGGNAGKEGRPAGDLVITFKTK
jgi:molecular chaperone DnaJ